MNLKSFLGLVEIKTKVASVIPFLVGTSFTLYHFNKFNVLQGIILFLGMFIFDMTITAINNYIDYTRAIKKDGFGYETHNALGNYNLRPNIVKATIIVMLGISIILGVILFLITDIFILIIGIICFAIGIAYSFGPIPISRTPFGEIISGLTMGFLITFLSVYIHVFDLNILGVSFVQGVMSLNFNIWILISIFVVSIPVISGISNIMLANNICDIEEDIVNRRYTLPIYIGKSNALKLYQAIYYIGFISIILGVIIGILPWISILTLGSFFVVNKNIKIFCDIQTKKDTFVLSVQNMILVNGIYVITIFIGALVENL